VLQQRLITLLDQLAQNVAVCEDLQPKLRNELIGEVVVLGLLLLLSQQFSDLLEVSIGKRMLSRDDIVDLIGQRVESLTEGSLDGLDLTLKLAVKFSLLDEIAVECDRLHLLRKGRQCLDLGLNLGLDVDLRELNTTSSYSSSQQSSEQSSGQSSTSYLAFLSLPPINNQLIYNNFISPNIPTHTHYYHIPLYNLLQKEKKKSLSVVCTVVFCLSVGEAVVVEMLEYFLCVN